LSTYAAFAAAYGALVVTGVSRRYDHVPASVNATDLPAQFVRLPNGGRDSGSVSTCAGSGKSRSIELVVLVEAVGLNNAEPNFDATIAVMDALETAIAGMTKPLPVIGYELRSVGLRVGDTDYWAVVATITGRNY
jgi:hypothetical protein